MKKQFFGRFVTILTLMLLTMTAIKAEAAATDSQFQPQSVSELIAYLYGVIASLEAQQDNNHVNSSGVSNVSSSKTSVQTLSATDIEKNSATLRSSVNVGTASYVYISFEYGTAKSVEDDTNEKKVLKGSKSTVSIDVDDLRTNTKYYYRAVLESANGKKQYGELKSFTTNKTSSGSNSNSSSNNSSSGDEFSFDSSTYEKWGTIKVELDLPSNLAFGAWIGLFAEGSANQAYIEWRSVDSEDEEITFSVPYKEGEYEFRLFKDSGYTKIATSDTFTVE